MSYTAEQRRRIIDALGREPVDLTPADEKEVEAARVRLRKRMRAKLKLALSPIQKPGQGPARPRAAIALVRAMERGTPTAELRYYKDVARIEVASKEG
jgi:hypothetical protein